MQIFNLFFEQWNLLVLGLSVALNHLYESCNKIMIWEEKLSSSWLSDSYSLLPLEICTLATEKKKSFHYKFGFSLGKHFVFAFSCYVVLLKNYVLIQKMYFFQNGFIFIRYMATTPSSKLYCLNGLLAAVLQKIELIICSFTGPA